MLMELLIFKGKRLLARHLHPCRWDNSRFEADEEMRRDNNAPALSIRLLQQALDHAAGLGKIHLARIALLEHIHAFAHVAQARSAGLVDHRCA